MGTTRASLVTGRLAWTSNSLALASRPRRPSPHQGMYATELLSHAGLLAPASLHVRGGPVELDGRFPRTSCTAEDAVGCGKWGWLCRTGGRTGSTVACAFHRWALTFHRWVLAFHSGLFSTVR